MENNIRSNLLLDFYGAMLTEKQKEIMGMYLEYDASLSEIASELNTSRQAVYDSVKVSKALLEDFEKKLKCVERYLSNREILLKLSSQIEELKTVEENADRHKKLQNIQKKLEKVLQNQ